MSHQRSVVELGPRAVDVGYFNVKYTLGRKQVDGSWPIATGMFPSLAPRLATHQAGDIPGSRKVDGCTVDVDGVTYFVGREAEFNCSGVEPRVVAEDYSVTAKYLALLRGALFYMAEDAGEAQDMRISHLVVGLPLNTFSKYRHLLAERIQGDHVVGRAGESKRRIKVDSVHVIVQPLGALLNFGVASKGQMDGWTLVVDPGGGTLDWYVASKQKANWPRSGAYPKAMLACAYAVADQIQPAWRDQYEIINRIDTAIREKAPSFRVSGQMYAVADYRSTIDAVLDESIEKMFAKVGPTADIDQILLTGGGANVFYDHLTGRRPDIQAVLKRDDDPVFSNVRGFHVFGETRQHGRS